MSDKNITAAESPLVQVPLDIQRDSLSVTEVPFLGHVNLRGRPDNAGFMAAAKKVLGAELPTDNNTFITAGDNTVLWYGPDEWLIITPAGQQAALVQAMREALADTFAAVTDISGGNTVVDISGSDARALLAKGTPIDLHPSVFNVGQCAQTVFAHAGMTIYQYHDTPGYRLIIRRSFADYLATWILDAASAL